MNRVNALIVSISFFVVSQTAVYYLSRWHPLFAVVVLMGSIAIFFSCPPRVCHPRESGDHGDRHHSRSRSGMTGLRHWTSLYCAITLIADLFLIYVAAHATTDEAIATPWVFYAPVHFFIFSLSTWTLLIAARYRKSSILPLSMLHFFTAYSVVAFVVKLGFGYDPFIHRAAIKAVIADGVILPKQPYYVGEYVTLASLNFFTHIPLVYLERFFMPLAAALTIPGALLVGLRDGWGLRDRTARVFSHVVLLLPMMSLIFTVPHNITVLIWSIMVFLGPALAKQPRGWLPLLALGLLSLSFHPLLGIPTLILGLSLAFFPEPKRFTPFAIFLLQALLVPLMFVLNQHLLHAPLIADWNPFHRLIFFEGLFFDPYTKDGVPLFWQLLYGYWHWLPLLGGLLAAVGAFLLRKKPLSPLAASIPGLFIALFLMSTLFVIPGIVAYEQAEFSLRFKNAIGIALLPFVAVALAALDEKLKGKFALRSTLYALLALAMTAAWYFTSPQLNPKVQDSGASMSRADVEAVAAVEVQAHGEPYIALAPPMTTLAAVLQFGFYRETKPGVYFYPFGPGTLSDFFEQMIWDAPKRETVLAAMEYAGVKRAYFMVPAYWPWSDALATEAAKGADAKLDQPPGGMTVFEYRLK